jgi:hypothetical protein
MLKTNVDSLNDAVTLRSRENHQRVRPPMAEELGTTMTPTQLLPAPVSSLVSCLQ